MGWKREIRNPKSEARNLRSEGDAELEIRPAALRWAKHVASARDATCRDDAREWHERSEIKSETRNPKPSRRRVEFGLRNSGFFSPRCASQTCRRALGRGAAGRISDFGLRISQQIQRFLDRFEVLRGEAALFLSLAQLRFDLAFQFGHAVLVLGQLKLELPFLHAGAAELGDAVNQDRVEFRLVQELVPEELDIEVLERLIDVAGDDGQVGRLDGAVALLGDFKR